MKAIGGYFGLEMNDGNEYHYNAIGLNSGRNALLYILLFGKYKKILIPYFTCDVIIESIKKSDLSYEFYHIDSNFEPIFDFNKLGNMDLFLYTNYFGLKDEYIRKIAVKRFGLIVDNAQSFYSSPIDGVHTFYSPRKFFGVPDGGYLYTDINIDFTLPKSNSFQNSNHLLMRIDSDAESGYASFLNCEMMISNKNIGAMSNLTRAILKSINYKEKAIKRRHNFNLLNSKLGKKNYLDLNLSDNQVPMVYPFYSDSKKMRQKLIDNKIYIPKFWNNVLDCVPENSVEYNFTENIISLPIDQRYDDSDMRKIIKIIKIIEND